MQHSNTEHPDPCRTLWRTVIPSHRSPNSLAPIERWEVSTSDVKLKSVIGHETQGVWNGGSTQCEGVDVDPSYPEPRGGALTRARPSADTPILAVPDFEVDLALLVSTHGASECLSSWATRIPLMRE